MRDLEQDSRAVTGLRIAAAGAPVREVDENLDAFENDVVAFLTGNVRHKTNPACIVLVARVVQTLRLWQTSGDQAVAHIKYVPDSPDDKWWMVGPKWGKNSSPQRLASFLS
jgi:hypothetical protein